MRERPILFSAPMIRAILAGRKTQTRRKVKLIDPSETYSQWGDDGDPWPTYADEYGDWHNQPCPYGGPGDLLWCREAFRVFLGEDARIEYRAGGVCSLGWDKFGEWSDIAGSANPMPSAVGLGLAARADVNRWRPSIHMPRKASRITLEIKSVRVERLQEITDADAKAEGVANVDEFRGLWAGINGSESWRENCWVWVVEFANITPAVGVG